MNPLKNMHGTSAYGPRIHPITHKEGFHNGTDLRANYDDAYAIEDGVVELARITDYSIGTYMVINHGTFLAIYGHLSAFSYSQGEKVKKGDVVCTTGNSGASTAPHLHFEIREGTPKTLWTTDQNGKYETSVDPMKFLSQEIDYKALYEELQAKLDKLEEVMNEVFTR